MSDRQVPAGPARAHIRDLIDQGMSQAAICRATGVSSACISSLLHGQFNASRSPVQTIYSTTADKILALRYTPPEPKRGKPVICDPGTRFQPVGHRVGQCDDCGQLAPTQRLNGAQGLGEVLVKHPRPDAAPVPVPVEAPAPAGLPQATHPDCGSIRGSARHRREGTDTCLWCTIARRSYDQGVKATIARARREAASTVSAPLAEEIVAFCRAYVLQPWPPGRPAPRSRELAKRVVRAVDAELTVDDVPKVT
jgi:hypothetical protein